MVLFSTAHGQVLKDKSWSNGMFHFGDCLEIILGKPEPFEIGWLAGVRGRLVGVSRPACSDSSLSGSFRARILEGRFEGPLMSLKVKLSLM